MWKSYYFRVDKFPLQYHQTNLHKKPIDFACGHEIVPTRQDNKKSFRATVDDNHVDAFPLHSGDLATFQECLAYLWVAWQALTHFAYHKGCLISKWGQLSWQGVEEK